MIKIKQFNIGQSVARFSAVSRGYRVLTISSLLLVFFVTVALSEEPVSTTAPSDESSSSSISNLGSNVSVQILSESLDPKFVKLSPGTTVAWLNRGPNPIKVRFISHAVSTTCKAPQGFVLDDRGIFVSKSIKSGEIASLCFLERDEYHYEVEVDAAPSDSPSIVTRLEGTVKID